MNGSTFLQIFLLINVFVIGMLVPIGIKHAKAHFRPEEHDAEKPHRKMSAAAHLSIATKERLLHQAETNFQTIINRSTKELEHNLSSINIRLNKRIESLAHEIIENETKRYKSNLEKLRLEAADKINDAQNDIEKHQTELQNIIKEQQTKLEAELVEKVKLKEQQLMNDIDTKLADGIASFLTETMQHNVDIGAQSDYLIAMLDEHKTELKEGILR